MSKDPSKKPERPPITEVHKSFYKKVVLAAQHLADVAVQRAIAAAGTEPPELTRDLLHDFATMALDFRGPGQPIQHSRAFEGNIAGSHFFTLNTISLPDEGLPRAGAKTNPLFAGRLLSMTLLYGGPKLDEAQLWKTRLYTGQGTPPVFVNEEAARKFLIQTRPVDDNLADLWRLQESLPEKKFFHYPTSEELMVVLKNGLLAASADVDCLHVVEAANYDIAEREDPSLTDDTAWLATAMRQLGSPESD
jgi:hypothetical protein